MKIENKYIARNFNSSNSFNTISITNKLLNVDIKLNNVNEFVIYLISGEILYSNDFKYEIVKYDNNEIIVNFNKDDINVDIIYFIEHDIIKKKVIINKYDKRINYIDLESFEFENLENIYIPKKQNNIKEMANFSGYYVECGQPLYAKSLFFGMEFPMGENRLINNKYFSRYYYGDTIKAKLVIHNSIIGYSNGYTRLDIQKYFFSYIKKYSLPINFRLQYNSWYDHMLDISSDIICNSFNEIAKGFNKYDIKLDAYVIDDGWTNYRSVWEFNDKFPNELKEASEVVKNLNSSLGLWIGPRGGYGGTSKIMSDWLEENKHLNIGSKNKLTNDVNVADFNYLNKVKEKMLEYQGKYNITYWKIDGLLLKPDTPDESGNYAMHTMTKVYEYLLNLFDILRYDREKLGYNYFINLTSYVNPSPWFLNKINSMWIQVSEDIGFEGNGTYLQQMMTYRDSQYYEFLIEREIELPLYSLYNHEPIYAKTATKGYFDEIINSTYDDFYEYLLFISTRGNSFWELYYSYDLFDDKRWEVNAKALKIIKENYHILRHAKFFGFKPNEFKGIYGYICNEDDNYIISFRNPCDTNKKYILDDINISNFDYIIGNNNIKLDNNKIIVELDSNEIVIIKGKK